MTWLHQVTGHTIRQNNGHLAQHNSQYNPSTLLSLSIIVRRKFRTHLNLSELMLCGKGYVDCLSITRYCDTFFSNIFLQSK